MQSTDDVTIWVAPARSRPQNNLEPPEPPGHKSTCYTTILTKTCKIGAENLVYVIIHLVSDLNESCF